MPTNSADTTPVVPNFWVDAVEPVREFYMEKLGFDHLMGIVGKDGKLDFAIVRRENAMIMMGRPQEKIDGTAERYPTKRPLEVYVYVKDIDAYHAEVVKRGVKIKDPLTTQWWGDRNFGVQDPHGYQLWFGQTVGELQPPPGVKVV
jgi:PhnB protein